MPKEPRLKMSDSRQANPKVVTVEHFKVSYQHRIERTVLIYIQGICEVPLCMSAVRLTLYCKVTQIFAIDLLSLQSTVQNNKEEKYLYDETNFTHT